MAKAPAPKKKTTPSLSEAVIVYLKSSSHWYALVKPEIIIFEGITFVAGKQVTGKTGHRMEGKRTLIPFEHVASMIEFASEEELWSEPQPKHLPAPPDPSIQSVPLTSHEQTAEYQGPHRPRHGGGPRHRGGRPQRHRGGPNTMGGNDAHFQDRYDRNFNR
jgi:hypothetical protein